MKRWCRFLCVALVAGLGVAVRGEGLPSYYDRYRFLAAPPATWGDGLLGFAQPANLGLLDRLEARFHWSSEAGKVSGLQDWGLYTGVPHLGFSVQSQDHLGVSSTDYGLAAGFGSKALAMGAEYGFGGGDLPNDRMFSFGAVWRPARFVTLAGTGRFSLESNAYEWTGELGVRPLFSRRVTLFGDFAWRGNVSLADVPWSAGAALILWPGVDAVGRYFDGGSLTLGLTFNLGRTGAFSQSHLDSDGDFAHQSWAVRLGGLKEGLATSRLKAGKSYVAISGLGRVRYLKYRHFDAGGARLFELQADIRSATLDPRVATIALNLSGLSLLPEHAWEIRTALEEAKSAGKTVVVFVDHLGMTGYHLASVGDYVVMDPQGSLLLPGYAINKTYLRGSMEKVGLAFDEWRYFKYKSAAETLVRDDMSEADREQSQAFVDDWYEQTRKDVSAARRITEAAFDRLIDEGMLFTSDSALGSGLVDTIARWSDLDAVLRQVTGKRLKGMGRSDLLAHAQVRETWGEEPRVALVYGLGVCDMNSGIRARWLEKLFRKLAFDRRIKAVVFRVDSPGGDPLASDLVAQAVKLCAKHKPVIVSQGQVAASGGYWLSMCADSVVAGPSTVTGSIGVIGGWLHDEGAASKLGMSSDVVKRGAHADYDAGVNLPFLGMRIPRRPLTEAEQARVHTLMSDLYSRFTKSVAENRGLAQTRVDELAGGHIYSGVAAKANGLVDELGSLMYAIDLAMARAGIRNPADVKVEEFPNTAGWISLPWHAPGVLDSLPVEAWEEVLKLLAEFNGEALTLLLPGDYPDSEE